MRKQRKVEQALKTLEVERDELLKQLDDTVVRQVQAGEARRIVEDFSDGLNLVDDDFGRRCWCVDVLDVTARLEFSDGHRLIHIQVGGRYL